MRKCLPTEQKGQVDELVSCPFCGDRMRLLSAGRFKFFISHTCATGLQIHTGIGSKKNVLNKVQY